MRRKCIFLLLIVCGVVLSGCSSLKPKTFTLNVSPNWSTVEMRDALEYDRAWDTVLDLLVKNFEIDQALRTEGYLRTGWSYTWEGKYMKYYRVRVTLKFSPDRSQLQFLPEAQLMEKDGNWQIGTDARLVSTIKTDLMGTVGRTTR